MGAANTQWELLLVCSLTPSALLTPDSSPANEEMRVKPLYLTNQHTAK